MLGAYSSLFDCIDFQAQPNSVPAVKGSIVFSVPKKRGLTFECSKGTLRIPAHPNLEQERLHKQILYATVANTSLVLNKYMSL